MRKDYLSDIEASYKRFKFFVENKDFDEIIAMGVNGFFPNNLVVALKTLRDKDSVVERIDEYIRKNKFKTIFSLTRLDLSPTQTALDELRETISNYMDVEGIFNGTVVVEEHMFEERLRVALKENGDIPVDIFLSTAKDIFNDVNRGGLIKRYMTEVNKLDMGIKNIQNISRNLVELIPDTMELVKTEEYVASDETQTVASENHEETNTFLIIAEINKGVDFDYDGYVELIKYIRAHNTFSKEVHEEVANLYLSTRSDTAKKQLIAYINTLNSIDLRFNLIGNAIAERLKAATSVHSILQTALK